MRGIYEAIERHPETRRQLEQMRFRARLAVVRDRVQRLSERSREIEDLEITGRFGGVSWEEMENLAEPPWMVRGVIPERGLVQIFGDFGTMKTFSALDLGLTLADGRDGWFGHEIHGRDGGPRRVLYCPGEGHRGVSDRVILWAHERNDGRRVENFVPTRGLPMFSSDRDFVEFVMQNDAWCPDMVVIDTSARAMGDYDEGDTKEASQFVARCELLRDLWGCAVVIISHCGHNDKGRPRGAYAIPAACDTVIRFEQIGPKAARKTKATIIKQKDGAADITIGGEGYGFCGAPGTATLENGRRIESLVLQQCLVEHQRKSEETRELELVRAILEGDSKTWSTNALSERIAREGKTEVRGAQTIRKKLLTPASKGKGPAGEELAPYSRGRGRWGPPIEPDDDDES